MCVDDDFDVLHVEMLSNAPAATAAAPKWAGIKQEQVFSDLNCLFLMMLLLLLTK